MNPSLKLFAYIFIFTVDYTCCGYGYSRQLYPIRAYDGTYSMAFEDPPLNLSVTVNSRYEMIQITFSCDPGTRPYDHIFNFDEGDGRGFLNLEVVKEGRIIQEYVDMLQQFRDRCPSFGKRSPVAPDLQNYVANVANNTLKTDISARVLFLIKQE